MQEKTVALHGLEADSSHLAQVGKNNVYVYVYVFVFVY
jgi:hypothetical protein